MYSGKLDQAIENFSSAVRHAVSVLPQDEFIQYLGSIEQTDLRMMLSLFEQQEEYELCGVIFKAINQN